MPLNNILKPLYLAEATDGTEGGASTPSDRGDDYTSSLTIEEESKTDTQQAETVEDESEVKADEEKDEEEDERPRDKKGKFVPQVRMKEAVERERAEKEAYARKLAEYEEREKQRASADNLGEAQAQIKEMIKQHTSLMADGELEKAASLMEQILDFKEYISEKKAETKATQAKESAKEEIRYDSVVAKLEADYPAINPESETYDKGAVRQIQAMMMGLMSTERMSSAAALQEAVETILGKAKAETADSSKAEDAGVRRKEAAVKKALDAKNRQPASSQKVGMDHDKTGGALDSSAVMKLTYDEFVKLPDSKLSELRGDHI